MMGDVEQGVGFMFMWSSCTIPCKFKGNLHEIIDGTKHNAGMIS